MWTCDKCGKQQKIIVNLNVPKFWAKVKLVLEFPGVIETKTYDICEDCTGDFKPDVESKAEKKNLFNWLWGKLK